MNRLDKIVTFQPLGTEQLKKILDIELNLVQQRIFNTSTDRAFVFTLSDYEQGFPAGRRHRPQVRGAAPEARHRAAAGAAHLQPDRHRPGARRRLDSRRFRRRRQALSFAREAEGLAGAGYGPPGGYFGDLPGDDLLAGRSGGAGADPDSPQFEEIVATDRSWSRLSKRSEPRPQGAVGFFMTARRHAVGKPHRADGSVMRRFRLRRALAAAELQRISLVVAPILVTFRDWSAEASPDPPSGS